MMINNFISNCVTHRSEPLTVPDMAKSTAALSAAIEGKSVLVIGGAGSIGSSFISQLLPFKPASLTVVDLSENGLAELARTLRSDARLSQCIPSEFRLYPIDYYSYVFEKMFRTKCGHRSGECGGFDIIANFSAHKHVRSEKDIFSIEALLRNNLLNAKKLLDLLCEYPPESYFCVSTDKAANPVNIMGASKRIMEDLIFSYSDYFPVKTARFANVAFSNGSLLDGFLNRLDKLQPLSAPSDIKRYFVSPEESGQICLLSAMLGNNREIFFPKLKEEQMMGFDEIARQLLVEKGYTVMECSSDEEAIQASEALKQLSQLKQLKQGSKAYPVYFSKSDTSGEKSFEEFVTDTEETDMNRFNSLGVIINKPMPDREKIDTLLDNIEAVFNKKHQATKEEIVKIISDYLPNFEHIETGKSLDSKM